MMTVMGHTLGIDFIDQLNRFIRNRFPDRRRSKRKRAITKCCLTVCRSIEKRHGVWAGACVMMTFSAACQRHMLVLYCCGSGSTNKLFCKCFLH